MGTSNCLVTRIIQDIVCVQQKKKNHRGLKQLESEYMITDFPFLGELCLKVRS